MPLFAPSTPWRPVALATAGFSALYAVAVVFFYCDWLFDVPGADPLVYGDQFAFTQMTVVAFALLYLIVSGVALLRNREQRAYDRALRRKDEIIRRYQEARRDVNGHTGDGILMAQALGAGVLDMGNQMMFPFNDPLTLSAENVSGTFADCPIVNKQGKRFLDETADRFVMTAALMEQEDSLCFMVSDANSVYVTEASPGEDTLLRRGQLFRADTLEELAGQMGVPTDAFAAEMDRYNGFCAAGADEDFGRYFFDELSPVATPPFYASPATWAAHITIGGLNAPDDDFRVMTEAGEPIGGLYACGEVRNGICGVGSIADGVACGKVVAAA